ncbi:hypothetical protein RE428_14320 [Marinobacter nanhaiticus D15-8W]|uniref:hypothetical protein n=1 Tax=Marinobacter nanhaiticus TaxID=1305740 RepID=UPI0003A5546E|nr:hypothetical protein RE428_14320 [Marinobacter nanhaiticus D15-8W]
MLTRPIPRLVQAATERLAPMIRRFDPYYRDAFDDLVRPYIEEVAQALLRRRLRDRGQVIAEELIRADEEEVTRRIADSMSRFLVGEYQETGKTAERAGNTKTYGLVRASFTVRGDLPRRLQVGAFQAGRQYSAYVRFGGPGPRVVPDIEDAGILSIGIKLMGLPGHKLMADEKSTMDLTGISSPAFTTPDIWENVKLQKQIGLGTPAWYFVNPLDSHVLDMIMQGLYARAHANPLELTYHSCVPYRYGRERGRDRAIKFAVIPRLTRRSRITEFTDNYLREAMVRSLAREPAVFDFAIQFQADPVRMPIEDASIVWSERESPFIPVATLEIPTQRFDFAAQDAFARNLTYNPWHTLAVHRPLGNQNRARRDIYLRTSRVRQAINQERHIEPTGKENFGSDVVSLSETGEHAPRKATEPVS